MSMAPSYVTAISFLSSNSPTFLVLILLLHSVFWFNFAPDVSYRTIYNVPVKQAFDADRCIAVSSKWRYLWEQQDTMAG